MAPDPKPVRLSRTRMQTIRWHLGSVRTKVTAAVIALALVGGIAVIQLPAITEHLGGNPVAVKPTDKPEATTKPPVPKPVSKTPLERAQAALSEQLVASKAELAKSDGQVIQSLQIALQSGIEACMKIMKKASNVKSMDTCGAELVTLTEEVTTATLAAVVARQAKEAESGIATALATAEEERLRVEEVAVNDDRAARFAEELQNPPANWPAGRRNVLEPAHPSTVVNSTMTVTCASSAEVTFTSNGSIAVTGAKNGIGSENLIVNTRAGTLYAAASGAGHVDFNVTWVGECTR